ncbi:Myo-inositol-1-phosphate synthase [Sulfolobus islandicus Y.G.57.14]|jgi:myo-inositol-1-phosphate synthase|uniref:Myo-inositol-1-phosphate synthase n=10 Tax=Saccharolobus islandicus TaxID=43080 RepID=M9U948_SACIS|nr:inositol-3-phosphate synthase [Sulfolobus islandicus]ACP35429.1 Myo-inositol-1-phosphate synthase [Sulfolobus islandicus L.S.2.15]ACP38088.1 Myo-inositol-1-phosphate synthase [Sulfolobus islandicus M.14.25]ACP45595.1 Myo-inositol-1-phosphate synthase [Sulfolobus islandicus Y.G.57.14]ACP48617.1 Myo-inositol-1-phosphate synthase [Sulfolobus islandicus Y.N.15.51]ACP55267.1 Myo-inositol-1-phosphate synthase [Sulfolobus islandicus M.16.27]
MIRVAIAGLGNCASMLIQGIEYYKSKGDNYYEGLITPIIGGYKITDIEIVAAFDVSKNKIGKDLAEAIFQPPNITPKIVNMEKKGVKVSAGPVLDGVAQHMTNVFNPTYDGTLEKALDELKASKTEILLNLLPVGSENATRTYANIALMARTAFINAIPVFIASDPSGYFPNKFKEKNLPLAGDDIKSQLGATIFHRSITSLFRLRGVKVEETYQLNVGGNTDFLNMKTEERLISKRISKTEAVTSTLDNGEVIKSEGKIRIGPSDYVPFLGNTKVAYIYVKGSAFAGMPIKVEASLEVDDKANCAAVLVDVIRAVKVALDRKIGGPLEKVSAFYFKHPPIQAKDDEEAYRWFKEFIEM